MGIEEPAVHTVSTILQGFSRTDGVGLSAKKGCESRLSDDLGTHVPREFTRDELLAKIRTALEARLISDDYAQTLIELVELLSDAEPQA